MVGGTWNYMPISVAGAGFSALSPETGAVITLVHLVARCVTESSGVQAEFGRQGLIGRPQNTKTQVAVAIGSVVPVAVGNTRVPRVVVPAATTEDTLGA